MTPHRRLAWLYMPTILTYHRINRAHDLRVAPSAFNDNNLRRPSLSPDAQKGCGVIPASQLTLSSPVHAAPNTLGAETRAQTSDRLTHSGAVATSNFRSPIMDSFSARDQRHRGMMEKGSDKLLMAIRQLQAAMIAERQA